MPMSFVSSVTAAVKAMALPHAMFAPVVSVMLACATIDPEKSVVVPRVVSKRNPAMSDARRISVRIVTMTVRPSPAGVAGADLLKVSILLSPLLAG
jgi:uncharacterized membrane protein